MRMLNVRVLALMNVYILNYKDANVLTVVVLFSYLHGNIFFWKREDQRHHSDNRVWVHFKASTHLEVEIPPIPNRVFP